MPHGIRITTSLATPAILSAVRLGGTNVINWFVASRKVDDFNLQRRIDGGAWSDMSSPSSAARQATDSSSSAAGTYDYRIRGRRGNRYSSFSNIGQVVVVSGPPANLIQESDITYVGAVRGLAADGGYGLSYYPTNNSLFLTSLITDHQILEQGPIPTPINSTTIGDLNSIGVIQNRVDMTPPDLGGIDNTWNVWGTMPFNGHVYCTIRQFYDANLAATKSHLKVANGTTSLSGTKTGLFKIGANNPAFYAGYMATIPSEWQVDFGDMPLLCGASGMPIVTRSSFGPTAFAFNPDDLGAVTAPEVEMVAYPFPAHPIAQGDTQSLIYNHRSGISGCIFVDGTDSVLFFGAHGIGEVYYGTGTADEELHGTQHPDGDIWVYDPCDLGKGYHAYPYRSQVWAYDANDLKSVGDGDAEMWEVSPYSIWQFDMPITLCSGQINGVAWIPGSRRFILTTPVGPFGEVIGHVYGLPAL